jgi:hypothetical protein
VSWTGSEVRASSLWELGHPIFAVCHLLACGGRGLEGGDKVMPQAVGIMSSVEPIRHGVKKSLSASITHSHLWPTGSLPEADMAFGVSYASGAFEGPRPCLPGTVVTFSLDLFREAERDLLSSHSYSFKKGGCVCGQPRPFLLVRTYVTTVRSCQTKCRVSGSALGFGFPIPTENKMRPER